MATTRPLAARELVCMHSPGDRTSYTIRFRRTERPSPPSTVQNSQLSLIRERFLMRQQFSIYRAETALFAAALVFVSMSAFGQTGQGSNAGDAAQRPATQPGEMVQRLSSDDAVKLALEQNLGIQ